MTYDRVSPIPRRSDNNTTEFHTTHPTAEKNSTAAPSAVLGAAESAPEVAYTPIIFKTREYIYRHLRAEKIQNNYCIL